MSACPCAQELICDTFISGLTSSTRRQRLLEKNTFTLGEAVQHARILKLTQRNTVSYQSPAPSPTSAIPSAASNSVSLGDECVPDSSRKGKEDGNSSVADASTLYTSATVMEGSATFVDAVITLAPDVLLMAKYG